MTRLAIATELCRLTAAAIRIKAASTRRQRRRVTSTILHTRQANALERQIAAAAAPVLRRQVDDAAKRIAEMDVVVGTKHLSHNQQSHGRGGGGLRVTRNPELESMKLSGGYDTSTSMKENFERTSNSLFGKNLSPEQVAAMAGAQDGSTVNITVRKTEFVVQFHNKGLGIENAKRTIQKDGNKTEMENHVFRIEKSFQGKGTGARVFNQQVQIASENGLTAIRTFGAGDSSSNQNGYYTWPRLGYDSIGKMPMGFGNANRVSDLMKTKEGRTKWKAKGSGLRMKFDLNKGSQSRKVLDAYVKQRFGKGSGKSASPDQRGRQDFGQDLGRFGGRKSPTVEEMATQAIAPAAEQFYEELIDAAMPVMANAMGKAGWAELLLAGSETAVQKALMRRYETKHLSHNQSTHGRGGGKAERDRKIIKAADEISALARDDLVEYSILLDENGNKVGGIHKGATAAQVGLSDEAMQALNSGDIKNATIVHNHPAKKGEALKEFTRTDLQSLGAKELSSIAVTHPFEDTTTIITKRKTKLSEDRWDRVIDVVQGNSAKISGSKIDFKRVSNRVLEKIGVVDLTEKLAGATNKHVKKFSQEYDSAVSATTVKVKIALKKRQASRPKDRPLWDDISKSTPTQTKAPKTDQAPQAYSRRNEQVLAKAIGGIVTAVTDPVDIIWKDGRNIYGIEMKTLLYQTHDKLKVDPHAKEKKDEWERTTGGTVHTVIFDDREVIPGNTQAAKAQALARFMAGDKTGFDFKKREIYHKRGYGSFRLGGMELVKGVAALKKAMRGEVGEEKHLSHNQQSHGRGGGGGGGQQAALDKAKAVSVDGFIDTDEIWGFEEQPYDVSGADFLKEGKVVQLRLDKGKITGTQSFVELDRVNKFIKNPDIRSGSSAEDRLPKVIRHKNKFYIHDGHHGLAADFFMGKKTANVVFLESDDPGTADRSSWLSSSSISIADLSKSSPAQTKALMATEWLNATGIEPAPGLSTELPDWMIASIEQELAATFKEPYWREIVAETTKNDIQKIIGKGLEEGMGAKRISEEIIATLGNEYYEGRAMAIARTEASGALNGARVASMDALAAELGPELPMRPAWLSVLGTTTRATHADLDGVPADDNGLFNLGGTLVPYPGHRSLPVEQRIFCQCSLVNELGLKDGTANQIIADYDVRVEETLRREEEEAANATQKET